MVVVVVVRKRAEAGEKCGERDGRVKSCSSSSTSTYNIGGECEINAMTKLSVCYLSPSVSYLALSILTICLHIVHILIICPLF